MDNTLYITSFDGEKMTVKETFAIGPLGDMKEFNYPIHFVPWPIEREKKDVMEEWCDKNCNESYHCGLYTFWFQDEHDAMAFKLAWT